MTKETIHENVVEEFKFVLDRLQSNLRQKVLTTPSRKARWFRRAVTDNELPPTAVYVQLTEIDVIVEDVRRLAELVVTGENAVTAGEKQPQKSRPSKESWNDHRNSFGEDAADVTDEYRFATTLQYHAQLFDLFIEQHVLPYMVDLVLGTLFVASTDEEHSPKLLPPLSVATQAIQSISILIQNVSKVTSLYLLLSNDNINRLSQQLPLEDYMAAERHAQMQQSVPEKGMPLTFPALTEFTTHFVTLLKSLAMRVTPETVQFFLQYPCPPERPQLQFPLYDRALEFCAAHHDSLVRTTAMNICLNVLRLTTVEDNNDKGTHQDDPPALPAGVLHTSHLPFSDRLLIAQYACLPRRVEPLIAPIFTKLAERWNALEEHLRDMPPESSESTAKAVLVKHQVRVNRWLSQLRNQADQLHDELLFLQDVFQVGLTSLNEQLIEMMLATFVYPLQLQPLLLYCKRVESPEHTNEREIPATVWAPAQAALFTAAACFHFLEHPALLKLLWVALFHPLSPDATSVPTIRAQLQVEAVNEAGRPCLRLDSPHALTIDSRETYPFGSRVTNATLPETSADEACIFVLAPALQQVLAFRGQDLALIARTKPNPYRQAWLTCLQPSTSQFSLTLRHLAVGALDAAVQALPVSLVTPILLGTDLKQLQDDIPIDERDLDSTAAHADDRGLGNSNVHYSRHALTKSKGVGSDHSGAVVSRLAASVMYQSSGQQQVYDPVAAHALLYFVYTHSQALKLAAQSVDSVWRHAAHVSCRSAVLLKHSPSLRGTPSMQDPRHDDRLATALMDILIYGSGDFPEFQPGLAEFLVQSASAEEQYPLCTLAVWSCSTFSDLTGLIGKHFKRTDSKHSDEVKVLEEKRASLHYIWQLDALASLLRDFAATAGIALRSVSQLTSLVFLADGTFAKKEFMSIHRQRQAYALLSSKALDTLFCEDAVKVLPETGSLIDIAGNLAVPCVCEAPPKSSLPIAEGVSWLSLYLVPQDGSLLFVQQDMKLLMACPLERVWIVPDPESPADDSSARKLLLQYCWIDSNPPPLFLFDNPVPKPEVVEHCFSKLQLNTSTCNVWFENQSIADNAMSLLIRAIFIARSTRGERIQQLFSP